ncbi:Clathrin interactor EPSIN 2 [Hibiscus syriacus]|uniref:Clathrin interactor EPSIN 2 n=1 Tax=Hibiscus syriacus TaxID=106335 RepID=A0A6A3AEH9_HIBSY|nr:clathrin interactor EPSIN 2-like [Hibiscus syriacus]KAE8702960.1 Clathrin interactor EPSIN 2 [Hibiscus syriacus]
MKKAIGQTVRELKREVNKKVLKVPGIEQKVLDATSNEPWGPHGSLLADIAMATRNYHEYQMIMTVIWKRLSDTGKNWRHVYKALTVLEYLVANGSERVIDDIREHSYQVSTLSNFQYIDSSGRDQGNNVRKKSQSLVALVNDKERIIEVRQKAAANMDKFRNTSTGGMYRPGSGGYGDRYDYGNRDYDDQNGYGRDREYGYRDDDRYGRYGDSNSRDGDRYGRDYEDRNSRDGYRDDDYRGRSRSVDDYQYGTRSRSSDRDHAFDEDGASSRGSGARADDHSQDGRQNEQKHSEQNVGAPGYEEAASETQSPVHSERVGQASVAAALGASPPPPNYNPNQAAPDLSNSASLPNQQVEAFDEFDPRGPVSAAPTTAAAVPAPDVPTASTNVEMDLLDALSDSFAIVPVTPENLATESDAHANSDALPTFAANQSASNFGNQGFDDPFGDNPFKAVPSTDAAPAAQQISTSMPTFQSATNQNAVAPQLPSANSETVTNFNFGDSFSANAYSAPGVSTVQPPSTNPQFLPQELSTPNQENNSLADIFPPSGPAQPSASTYGQSVQPSVYPYSQPPQPGANPYGQPSQPNANPYGQPAQPNANPYGQPAQPNANPYAQTMQPNSNNSYGNFNPQTVSMAPQILESAAQSSNGSFNSRIGSNAPVSSHKSAQPQNNNDLLGGLISQPGSKPSMAPQTVTPSAGALAIVPVSEPSKDKFEMKSAVWADTLSRGLVNLNISGPKTNPLADIGVDFDALNRKEKRMEKPAPNAVTSTVTMGKAMGSGSGIGRSGASSLRTPANPMAGSGMSRMGMGMGFGPAGGMGMGGGYGGMNQQSMGMGMGMNNMGMNPGMGMNNVGMNPGMRMNMGMGQRPYMQPQAGMPGGYNPMMGSGGYSQQPYGGGYQ